MELGILLFVIRDATNYMESKGMLKSNGRFGTFTPQADAELASIIETSLKLHGVTIQKQVDAAIKMLPLIMAMAGVK
jgi:hypothetical protein